MEWNKRGKRLKEYTTISIHINITILQNNLYSTKMASTFTRLV